MPNVTMRSNRWIVMISCAVLLFVFVYLLSSLNQKQFLFSKRKTDQALHRNIHFSNSINTKRDLESDLSNLAKDKRRTALSEIPFTPMSLASDGNLTDDIGRILDSLNKEKVKQDHPQLVKIIRDYFIFPPSKEAYNLNNPDILDYSRGQSPFVDSRLKYMESGFYVECGALDGEKGSNSLFFEKVRKWNGLLIEGDPENYRDLKSKNRKAFTINACLNPYQFPSRMQFNKAYNRGRVIHDDNSLNWIQKQNIQMKSVNMQCFPFYSILLAMNQTRVDFFSLDIEGDELSVLKTIPWNKVDIRMLAVEYVHGKNKGSELQRYMEKMGYDTLLKMQRDDGGVNDLIFRKKGLTH